MQQKAMSSGINFGLTSGVITTLGLIVGLHSGTNSMLAVIGGILTIAVADSLSDALGIHISKESEADASNKDIWLATLMTLLTKMGMSLTFVIPVLLFSLEWAIVISIAWGLFIIALLSFFLAKKSGNNPLSVMAEHLTITILVIFASHYIGEWVAREFA